MIVPSCILWVDNANREFCGGVRVVPGGPIAVFQWSSLCAHCAFAFWVHSTGSIVEGSTEPPPSSPITLVVTLCKPCRRLSAESKFVVHEVTISIFQEKPALSDPAPAPLAPMKAWV